MASTSSATAKSTPALSPAIAAMFSLEGRTAIVTGGSRGIGAAMAVALAEAGADVVLVQRNDSNTTTRDTINALPNRHATIITADLSDPKSVSTVIPTITSPDFLSSQRQDRPYPRTAFPDISILVCAAGIQARHPAHEFPDSDWHQVLQVNLTTVFQLSRDFGAYLLSRDTPQIQPQPLPPGRSTRKLGSIIHLASLLSFSGGLTVPAYAASKGGLTQLTKALSNEWAKHGITVNAVAPGYIDTDMNTALISDESRNRGIMERIPMGRWGRPEDFAGVAVWLAGEGGGYVSGSVVVVDGGWMGR